MVSGGPGGSAQWVRVSGELGRRLEVGFQRILEKKVQNSISHGIGSLLGKQNWKEENFFFY